MSRRRGWALPWRRIWLAAFVLLCLFPAFGWAVGSGDAIRLVALSIAGVAWLGFTMDAQDKGCLTTLATTAALCLGELTVLAQHVILASGSPRRAASPAGGARHEDGTVWRLS